LHQPFRDAARQLNRRCADFFLRLGLSGVREKARLGRHLLRRGSDAHISWRRVTGWRDAMVDDEWLNGVLLLLGVGRWSRGARQQVARLLAHHHLAVRRGEHRQQADFQLGATDAVPGNPDAVRSSEFRRAEMRGELLRREDELAIRLAAIPARRGVVEAVDHQLPFDGDGLIFLIVKIEAAAEAAHARLAWQVQHGGRPKRDDARWRLILILLLGLGIGIPKLLPALAKRPAFGANRQRAVPGRAQQHGDQQIAKRVFHDSHP